MERFIGNKEGGGERMNKFIKNLSLFIFLAVVESIILMIIVKFAVKLFVKLAS